VGQPLANRGFIDPGRRGLGHLWRRPRDTLSRSRSCARAVAGLFFPGPFLPGAAACKKCPEEERGDEHSAGYVEYFAPYWHSLIRLHSLFDLTACRRIVYLSPLSTPSLLLRLAPPENCLSARCPRGWEETTRRFQFIGEAHNASGRGRLRDVRQVHAFYAGRGWSKGSIFPGSYRTYHRATAWRRMGEWRPSWQVVAGSVGWSCCGEV
jgi:hypothetical protein